MDLMIKIACVVGVWKMPTKGNFFTVGGQTNEHFTCVTSSTGER